MATARPVKASGMLLLIVLARDCQEDKKGSYQKRKPYGCQGFAYFRCVPAAADFSNGPGFLTCPVTSVCLGVLIAVPFHEPAPPVFFLP